MKHNTFLFLTAAAFLSCGAPSVSAQNTPSAPAQNQKQPSYLERIQEINGFKSKKDYANWRKTARELLADKTLKANELTQVWFSLYESYVWERDFENAFKTTEEFLDSKTGTEQDIKNFQNYRATSRIALLNKLQEKRDYAGMAEFARELLADKKIPAQFRNQIWNSLYFSYRWSAKPAEAIAVCDEYLASPDGTPLDKAEYLRRKAETMGPQGLKKNAESEKMLVDMLSDPAQTSATLTNVFATYSDLMNNTRRAKDKSILEYGEKILARPDIKPGEKDQVCSRIVRSLEGDAQVKFGKTCLERPDIVNWYYMEILRNILNTLIEDKKFAEAEALVRKNIERPDLKGGDLYLAYQNMGNYLRAQGKTDEAVAFYRSMLQKDSSEQAKKSVSNNVVAEYYAAGRIDDVLAILQADNNVLEQIKILNELGFFDKSSALAEKTVADEKLPEDVRKTAFMQMIGGLSWNGHPCVSLDVIKKYADFATKDGKFNVGAVRQAFNNQLLLGNFEKALFLFELRKRHETKLSDYNDILAGVRIYAGASRPADAAALAREFEKTPSYTPAQRFILSVCAAALDSIGKPGAFTKAYHALSSASKGVSPKEKADAVITAGRCLLLASATAEAMEAEKLMNALYKPETRKTMTVPFMKKPVNSLSDFNKIFWAPKPGLLDRVYGGTMDFLETDVSTGSRGSAAGKDQPAEKVRPPEFTPLCDVNGLHLFFRVFDSKIEDVKAGLLSGGAFEMYLSCGINQPYICLLPDLSNGPKGQKDDIWQTTYSNELYTRPSLEQGYFKEFRYTEDGAELHIFLPWDIYFRVLPDKGDIWEFESFFWSRFGNLAWNGSKTIHGRSSWGYLVFDLTPDQKRAIKREIIYRAVPGYKADKVTTARGHSPVDIWADPDLGDPVFYKDVVAPYVEKLDSYLPLVKADMTDADVDKVYDEALPGWVNLRFRIADMREKYLREQLSK